MYNLNSEFRKVVKINICLSSKLWHQRDMMVCLKPSTTDMRTFSRPLLICYISHTMTSIHAALVRLNVATRKISFWEVQLENAIKRAEFLVPANKSATDVLEENGIHVDVKCSDGICGVCKCDLISGDVEHRDFVLSKSQRETSIILCQSRAANNAGIVEIDL